MSRRLAALAVVSVALLPTPPTAFAAGAKTAETPRTNCTTRLVDPENDAKYRAGSVEVPTNGNRTNVVGTDITGFNLRLTADELQVFLKIKDVPTPAQMPATDVAYVYAVNFKYDSKTFEFQHEVINATYNQDISAVPVAGTTPFPSDEKLYPKGNTGSGSANMLPGFEADINATTDFIVFTAPRERVHTNLDHVLVEGDRFTDITASTRIWTATPGDSDKLDVAAADAVWTVGDDRCFGPPPATLTDLLAPAVQFGDTVTLSAKLTKEDGTTPLADKAVEFVVGAGSAPVTRTTDANGVVKLPYTASLPAGTHPVTATFAGDTTDGRAKATQTIKVTSEVTKFAPLKVVKSSATSRVVTATLLDNDGKAVGAVKVDWYVNGKKVATVATDKAGRSVYRGAKAAQTVQARFAGVAGKYLGAMSAKTKV